MSETKKQHKRKKQYTFEEDAAIVARTIINVVDTSIVDPHPFIVALLEGYAQRGRAYSVLPEMPDVRKGE